jgi:hypothetical protein
MLCERLVVPMHTAPSGHYDEEILGGVRRLLLDAYGERDDDEGGARLYISRGRALKRRIANEEEVVAVVRGFGFRVVYAEDHTFEEQVALASRACLSYAIRRIGSTTATSRWPPRSASNTSTRPAPPTTPRKTRTLRTCALTPTRSPTTSA